MIHTDQLRYVIPDCNNRNAMQDVLVALSKAEKAELGEWLAVKLGANDDYYEGWMGVGPTLFFELATTPLPLLVEGFLRVKRLWK